MEPANGVAAERRKGRGKVPDSHPAARTHASGSASMPGIPGTLQTPPHITFQHLFKAGPSFSSPCSSPRSDPGTSARKAKEPGRCMPPGLPGPAWREAGMAPGEPRCLIFQSLLCVPHHTPSPLGLSAVDPRTRRFRLHQAQLRAFGKRSARAEAMGLDKRGTGAKGCPEGVEGLAGREDPER